MLPTVGGQTALNLSVELFEQGILEKFGVKLIGANIDSIKVGEDRELFKEAMDEIGIPSAKGGFAHTWEEAQKIVEETGYPAIIRPAFTLGGTGGGMAYNPEEFEEIVERRTCCFADFADFDRRIDSRLERIRTRSDARSE